MAPSITSPITTFALAKSPAIRNARASMAWASNRLEPPRREESGGTCEEIRGRAHIAEAERPARGPGQSIGGPGGKLLAMQVVGLQLEVVTLGLLKVIAHELVDFPVPALELGFHPCCEALVQFSPLRLRQRLVRGLTDECVPEPVGLLVGQLVRYRLDESLPDERQQVGLNGRPRLCRT